MLQTLQLEEQLVLGKQLPQIYFLNIFDLNYHCLNHSNFTNLCFQKTMMLILYCCNGRLGGGGGELT